MSGNTKPEHILAKANALSAAGTTTDLTGIRRLHALQVRLAGETDLHVALEEIVAAACGFLGTDRGCVELVGDDGERLQMVAVRGYEPGSPFIAHVLDQRSDPARHAARRDRTRLIIEDIESCSALAGTKDRDVALADGIRAMQSTPIVDRNGEFLGLLSNQFRAPRRLGDEQLKLIDLLAWAAADFIGRHRTNAVLKEREERHRALLGELQHRVRNSLAVIRSIARRTALTSETVEDFSMHLDGRLASFARAQAVATGHGSGGVDLRSVVIDELAALAAREGGQAHVSGPDIALQPKAGETLALAFHELATNAVKFGSLSVAAGTVRVSWTVAAGDGGRDQLVIRWDEDRPDTPISPPTRRGFGTELLEDTLSYELDADALLDFRPSGLLCTIIVPLTAAIRATS